MKILWEGRIRDTGVAISSDNEVLNYPADNIRNTSLYKRLQASGIEDTILIELPETTDIDCFFFGYTNAESVIIKLYDSGDVLLHTETVLAPGYIEALYFTMVQADYITIELEADSDATAVYLGGVDYGLVQNMPDPLAEWPDDIIDNSAVSDSYHGQTLQNYIEPLMRYEWQFRNVERETALEIQDLYIEKGVGGHIWVDATEENHDFIHPIYATIREPVKLQKDGRRYRFPLIIREAR